MRSFLFACFQITLFCQKVCAVGWGLPISSDLNTSSYDFVPFRTFYFQSSRKYSNRILIQSLLAILPVGSWAYSEEGILPPERILSSLPTSFSSVQRQKRTLYLDRTPQAMNLAQFKIKNCQSCCALVAFFLFVFFFNTGQSPFRGKPVKSCVLADFPGCGAINIRTIPQWPWEHFTGISTADSSFAAHPRTVIFLWSSRHENG